jgi:hypothetical protein
MACAEARTRPTQPPKQPPRQGSGSGRAEDDEHSERLSELSALIKKGLRQANLTESQRRQYRRASQGVIDRLSRGAVLRLHANTGEFKFYPSHEALTQAIKEKYPALAKKLQPRSIIKGMLDKDGTIHLDGGGTLRGRDARLVDFYAHEIAHGIDGIGHQLSDSKGWGQVWAYEILGNDAFTTKAQDDHREAFSEVGSLLLGGAISAKELALLCPGVVRFWRDQHKLLAGG